MDWDKLLSDALKAGVTIDQFWNSTLREIDFIIKAYLYKFDLHRDLIAFGAWNTAALTRVKKMPKLEEYMRQFKSGETRKQTPEDHFRILSLLAGTKKI